MTNGIISGIAQSIKAEYGCRVYGDNVPQNAIRPFFTVSLISAGDYQQLMNDKRKVRQFSVEYHPNDYENSNEECCEMAEVISDLLYEINACGRKLRASNIESVISDGTLVSTVAYEYYTLKTDEVSKMEVLKEEVDIDGEQKDS